MKESARLPDPLERWLRMDCSGLKAASVVAPPPRPYLAQIGKSLLREHEGIQFPPKRVVIKPFFLSSGIHLIVSKLDNRARSTITDVTVMSAVVIRPQTAQRTSTTDAIRKPGPSSPTRIPIPKAP
jgi:hypothetical protein